MKRSIKLLAFLAVLWLIAVTGGVYAQQQGERSEEAAFARIIVDEYISLLERRLSERSAHSSSAKESIFAEHDRQAIRDIRESLLSKIDSGQVDVVVQPSGLIAVETVDRRIALQAPNQDWDDEFKGVVKWRSTGNRFAVATIEEAERREGKRFPQYNGGKLKGVSVTIVYVDRRKGDAERVQRLLASLGANVKMNNTSDSGNSGFIGKVFYSKADRSLAEAVANAVTGIERVAPASEKGPYPELRLWIAR